MKQISCNDKVKKKKKKKKLLLSFLDPQTHNQLTGWLINKTEGQFRLVTSSLCSYDSSLI